MQRETIDSSLIAEVGYDERSAVLEVLLTSGRTYHFFLVPRAEYHALLAAESKGAYFNQNIRTRFRCVEVV